MHRVFAAVVALPLLLGISLAAGAQCRSIHGVEHLVAEMRKAPPQAAAPAPAGKSAERRPEQRDAAGIDLTLAQLQAVIDVRGRIAKVASRLPPVGICFSEQLQAVAIAASASLPDGAIVFSSGLLRLLAADNVAYRDSVAVVMAHEYAHIVEEHSKRQATFARQAQARGASVGISVALATGSLSAGRLTAVLESLTHQRAFSRAVELEADRVGYELYVAAGFDPRNAAKPLRLMLAQKGTRPVHYLDSHPALDERITRVDALARDDIARADRAKNAEAQASTNAAYLAQARELWEARQWRELAVYVDAWLRDLPDSSPAWYYRGLLLRGAQATRGRAWEAFERAVNFNPNDADAWRALCVSLREATHHAEAAVCVGAMAHLGHPTGDLREAGFNGRLWVGGRIEAPSPPLWWAREPSGSKLITNDRALLLNRGAGARPLPPGWVPPAP